VIGQSLPRVDIPAKVTGQAILRHGCPDGGDEQWAVVRPPTLVALPKSFQAGQAGEVEGVIQVVIADDFAGVVAESRAAAQAAVARIHATWKKAIAGSRQSWSSWSRWESDGAVIQEVGDVSRRLGDGATLTAEYRTPLAVHTPLEGASCAGGRAA
jgi:hypothetical protein